MSNVGCREQEHMAVLTIEDILAATGGKILCGDSGYFTGICIDSRKIQAGELFVALKGERRDGHDFVAQALDTGSGALVERPVTAPAGGKSIILVRDTLRALQDIGYFCRMKNDLPVIAVTGSNGKTTTKELIASVLGTQYRTLRNTGNLNNEIGLPLSLTRRTDDDQIIVLEMGASAPGDIRELCTIAAPDYGVLTNISQAHLEGFKDMHAVRKTKLELLEAVRVAAVNADDHFLMEGLRESGFSGSVLRYGIKTPADIWATDIALHERGSSFQIQYADRGFFALKTPLAGVFNIYNILAAATIGYLFHIEPAQIVSAVESFAGVPMRMEFREVNGITIICDMYNANPVSMREALRELVRISKKRSIAVLGDMLELGSEEEHAHRELGAFMAELPVAVFIAVGPRMEIAAAEFRGQVRHAGSAREAGILLRETWKAGDTVLIKGSRGMQMEMVLEA